MARRSRKVTSLTNLKLIDGDDNSSVSEVTMLGEGRKDRVLIESGDGRTATADYDARKSEPLSGL